MSLLQPQIPGYAIERIIGQGGMATVYLARQLSLDRLVAIKLMVPEASADENQARRFEAEARVIARLEHPHIVGIHEVGRTDEGRLYYVMPYLPNGDLAHRNLADDEMRVLEILNAVLDALGYAHARGIVHRDVKAENVLFDSSDRPRLADFGIALSRRTGKPRITTDGLALGSSGYMAPEQARGEVLDGRADLYSLAVLTYELLTGELPFQSEDPLALALMHDQDPVPQLPASKRHWQWFLNRAMAKRPAQRFRTSTAMQRALQQVERAIRRRNRGSWLPRLGAWLGPGRLKPVALMAGGVTLALLVVMGVQRMLDDTDDPPAVPLVVQEEPDEPATAIEESVSGLLARASSQIAQGQLVVPAGDNAAESVLHALRIDPLSEEARDALQGVFDALADSIALAFVDADDNLVAERIEQARMLADALGETGAHAFQGVAASSLAAAEGAIEGALENDDRARAAAIITLVERQGLETATLDSLLAEYQPPAAPGDRLRDRGGPVLRLIPPEILVGNRRSRVDAMMVAMEAPVSHADFGHFINATNHQVSRCRSLLSPLRLLDQRDWQRPGYQPTPRSPVVCISPADAEAFAAWLTRRTGQRYRLPGIEEHQHIALFGSSRLSGTTPPTVAEWTAACSPPSAGGDDCKRRTALDPGLDGQRWPLERRELDASRGYDDVGFRLVRERRDGEMLEVVE